MTNIMTQPCQVTLVFSQVLHNAFPRFAERGEGGGYQQQDANECWMEILRMLQVKKNSKPKFDWTLNILDGNSLDYCSDYSEF